MSDGSELEEATISGRQEAMTSGELTAAGLVERYLDRIGLMRAIVWRDGRVTIPEQLRDRLRMQPGMVLDLRDEGGDW